jgi:hypothetical protein
MPKWLRIVLILAAVVALDVITPSIIPMDDFSAMVFGCLVGWLAFVGIVCSGAVD